MSSFTVEPVDREHHLDQFSSGAAELDVWLREFALVAEAAGTARTFVLVSGDRVAGYHSLAMAQAALEELPARHARGVGRHPVPMVLLARLAVSDDYQRRGLGGLLLVDAAGRAMTAAESVGARGMLVHARDERAAKFYERFQFTPSPTDPLHLMVLWKDLRKTLAGQ